MLSKKFISNIENIFSKNGLKIQDDYVSNHFHGWIMNYSGIYIYNDSVKFRFEYNRSNINQNFFLFIEISQHDSFRIKSKSIISVESLRHYFTTNKERYGRYIVEGDFIRLLKEKPVFQEALRKLNLDDLSIIALDDSINIEYKSKKVIEENAFETVLTKILVIVQFIVTRS
ncbi:MAG: hypothetical protein AAFN93_11315 [Bacteroidota bacterium]